MKYVIALGSNLKSATGTPIGTLLDALRLMKGESLHLIAVSRWYSTPAFPAGSGPDFVNAVALIEAGLTAPEVLVALHRIEDRLGRTRARRWAPRVIDLDLLVAGNLVLPDEATYRHWCDLPADKQTEAAPDTLILPHPRLHERAFVLVPMADVAPDWRHPVLGLSVSEMLERVPEPERNLVRVINPAQD